MAIFNVCRSNHESEEALELLIEEPKLFAPLIMQTRPPDKIGEALSIAEAYAMASGKMRVTWPRRGRTSSARGAAAG